MSGGSVATSISIVTTVMDEEGTIDHLLDALAPQVRGGDEIVVVDGGSRDGTVARVRDRARALPLQVIEAPGTNISEGRNIGISKARNDLVACTDAGCTPSTGWLDAFRTALTASPAPDLVTGVYSVAYDGALSESFARACYPQPEDLETPDALTTLYGRLFGRTFDATMPTGRSVAFRRGAWERVGGFPEHLRTAEDVTFGRAIAASGGRCVLVPAAAVRWDQRPTLKQTAEMYFRYGEGDGRSGDRRLIARNMLRMAGYTAGAIAVSNENLPLRLAVAAGATLYLSVPLGRGFRSRNPAVVAAIPLALAVKDLSKIAGCVIGIANGSR